MSNDKALQMAAAYVKAKIERKNKLREERITPHEVPDDSLCPDCIIERMGQETYAYMKEIGIIKESSS